MTTRYEITARHAKTGLTFLIGYSPRVSRRGLIDAMQKFGDEIVRLLDIGPRDQMTFHTKPGPHCIVGEWCIGFTGHTQRECRGREHPHIADLGDP
jgi:hypothetical protein